MVKTNLTKTSRMLIDFKEKLEARKKLLQMEVKLEIENNYPNSIINGVLNEFHEAKSLLEAINNLKRK